MTRKKRNRMFDDPDDFMDEPTAEDVMPDAEVAKVSLSDFMIPAKVSAFVGSYTPCDEFDAGAERFDDSRLREYFKAYVCGLGDPLALYIEDLKMANFRMTTSLATGEPCIFARRKC